MRTADGTGSGWAGGDSPRFSKLPASRLAEQAAKKAVDSSKPQTIEPGRYTVILEPQAVADLLGNIGNSFARRAADEAIARARNRRMFGRTLAELDLTQAKVGEMALVCDASALLVYRAAWARDVLHRRVTREASMAKLFATESAQSVIDAAVQMFGGLGVVRGVTVERLYREIRALRIYEGTSEVLKLLIGRKVLDGKP